MTTNPLKNGLILYVSTMLLFFLVYYFFGGANYYLISVKINAFVLPFIYTAAAFLAIWKIRQLGKIGFGQAFKQSFLSLFIGGVLSMGSIFLFLNYGDTEARNILNFQYVETQIQNMDDAYRSKVKEAGAFQDQKERKDYEQRYQETRSSMLQAQKNHRNYFSIQYISVLFSVIVLFYLFLSVILGTFLKTKKRFE